MAHLEFHTYYVILYKFELQYIYIYMYIYGLCIQICIFICISVCNIFCSAHSLFDSYGLAHPSGCRTFLRSLWLLFVVGFTNHFHETFEQQVAVNCYVVGTFQALIYQYFPLLLLLFLVLFSDFIFAYVAFVFVLFPLTTIQQFLFDL